MEFNVPFQHKYGYIRNESPGWRAIITQWMKASNILTLTLAAFCSAATQKGKGIERLIQIITLAPTTEDDNYHSARQKKIKYDKKHAYVKIHITQNQYTKN